jgi:hypothetical protein
MLRSFVSENGELVVRLFGYPDRFRRLHVEKWTEQNDKPFYIRVGKRYLSLSVIALWLFLWSLVGTIAAQLSARFNQLGTLPNAVTIAFVAMVVLVLLANALRRSHPLEKRATLLVLGIAFTLGILPVW